MTRPGLEVADVFRQYGDAYREQHDAALCRAQRRVMTAIERCRTAALGGHVEQCDQCDHQRISFNSCRNRHCPKCQSLARAQWLEDRRAELLYTQLCSVAIYVLSSQSGKTFPRRPSISQNINFLRQSNPFVINFKEVRRDRIAIQLS
jgi:hypothetical protein